MSSKRVAKASCAPASRFVEGALTVRGRGWGSTRSTASETRIGALVKFVPREPVIDGCTLPAKSLQAVRVEGGVAANVVPDSAQLLVSYRFAPDRDAKEAEASVREVFAHALDVEGGDTLRDRGGGTAGASGPLEQGASRFLIARSGAEPRAKLGWTDVAFLRGTRGSLQPTSVRGIPNSRTVRQSA